MRTTFSNTKDWLSNHILVTMTFSAVLAIIICACLYISLPTMQKQATLEDTIYEAQNIGYAYLNGEISAEDAMRRMNCLEMGVDGNGIDNYEDGWFEWRCYFQFFQMYADFDCLYHGFGTYCDGGVQVHLDVLDEILDEMEELGLK